MATDVITGEEIPDTDTSALESEESVTPPAKGDTGADELIMGKYKSQDDLVSAYKELQSANTKTAQENKEMRQRVAEAENPVLQKLVEVVSAKQETPQQTEAERQQIREKMLAELEDGGNEAILDTMIKMSNDGYAQAKDEYKADLEKLSAKIAELESGVGTLRDTSSDEYKANKDRIERLQSEGGFTREQALAIVKLEPTKAPAMAAPAGTFDGGGSPAGGGKQAWTNNDLIQFKKMYPSATPEEIEEFKKAGRVSA